MHSEYTIILELIPRASKKVNGGHTLRMQQGLSPCVDALIEYRHKGRVLAVASIYRDLRELAMEQQS